MSLLDAFLQNPQMVQAIASRCGISPDAATSVIQQLAPVLAQGLHTQLTSGNCPPAITSALSDTTHQDVATNPAAIQSHDTNSTLALVEHLLAGQGGTSAVVQQVSSASGVGSSALQTMLPILASVVMGSAGNQAASGGMQGLLGTLLQTAAAGQSQQGGGLLGSLLGMMSGAMAKRTA